MSKIRVALLFTSLVKGGGAEKQMKLLLEFLDKKKFTPFVYTFEGGKYEEEFQKINIPVRNLNVSPSNPKAIFALRKQLKQDEIDICHSLLMHGNLISRWSCLFTKIKLINSVRWAERIPFWHTVDKLTRGRVNYWIANSTHGATIAQLPKHKSRVIQNGILPKYLDAPLGKWTFTKQAVMIARFRREKQYLTLIQAAQQLPNWHFDCIGGGETQEAETLIKQLGITNVTIHGFIKGEEILTKYGASVLLSKSEGSPNTTLDSLTLGVPMIGSTIPAHEELLAHGRGILVDGYDPESVVKGFRKLEAMSDKERNDMRKKAKAYVQKHCSVKQLVTQTQDVYTALMRD